MLRSPHQLRDDTGARISIEAMEGLQKLGRTHLYASETGLSLAITALPASYPRPFDHK